MTSLSATIQDVFNEPSCAKNANKSEAEKKKGCTKQLQPGGAAGGCAFDGAKIALQPFTDVAHLVHGPIACEGNSWDNRGAASSGPELWRTSFTTDMNETDVVFGGEKRLFKSCREIIEKSDPPAIFVYQTCVPAMIGDDINAVCKAATEKFGKPVIPVNAPGFVGPKNLGNKLAGEALLDHVIGTVEPEFTTPYDINIIGEFNLSGELWQVKPLLDELGNRILTCIPGDGRYADVASAHRARASMMVCSKAMINVARKMEERYGIPFFEGSFYGIEDSSDSLRELARLLIERGLVEPEAMSLSALKAALRAMGSAPGEAGRRLIQENASYVFFRLDDSPERRLGPIGGAGLALSPLRSIAVDRSIWCYGLPFWIEADIPWRRPKPESLARLMIAQDTGSAILGEARADLYIGSGEKAGALAGGIRHEGRFFALLPKVD